jgi:peptidoglycan DL-endopeptidase CwlO
VRSLAIDAAVWSLLAILVSCAPASRHAGSRQPYGADSAGRWIAPYPPAFLATRAWDGQEPAATPRARAAVEFAWRQAGKPYCWGGGGPRCFDCSGLVQAAWGSVGVSLPRTADAMATRLHEVPLAQVRSGDVLWWPGHVGLYAGYGWIVEALDARDGVVRRLARKDPFRVFRPDAEARRSASVIARQL